MGEDAYTTVRAEPEVQLGLLSHCAPGQPGQEQRAFTHDHTRTSGSVDQSSHSLRRLCNS